MLKRVLITIVPALFYYLPVNAQQGWITFKVDEKISVKFPSAPAKKNANTYAYANKDSTIVLILGVHTEGDNDSDEDIMEEFFKNEDKIKDKNESAFPVFEQSTTGEWNGFTTIKSGFAIGNRKLSTYGLIGGSKGYSLFVMLIGDVDSKIKDDYFSSIALNK